MEDYLYDEPASQVVYLDTIVNSLRKEPKVKQKESYFKPNRYGSPHSYQQSVADTSHTDYASDADYDADPYYYGDKPNCDEGIVIT